MKAKSGKDVSLHFTGFLENGSVFDTSEGKTPIKFKLGSAEVIPGFNEGVLGMEIGEVRRIEIPPERGYGIYYDELIQEFPHTNFEGGIAEGLTVHGMIKGQKVTGNIVNIVKEKVLVDFNHPLAGEKLTFEVKLISIE